MAASHRQMVVKWDVDRDQRVLGNLGAYKARARGRRVRELALLGLEAERVGFRVKLVDGVAAVIPPELIGIAAQSLPSPAPAAELEAVTQRNVLSPDHRAGLGAMMDALDL